MKNGKLGGIVLGVVLAAGLIVGIKCMERVPAGYVGVVYNFSSGISDQVLTQGWHFVSPTKKVTTYSVGISHTLHPKIRVILQKMKVFLHQHLTENLLL